MTDEPTDPTTPKAPVSIPLDQLSDHPDYPRFAPRDDVTDAILAGLGTAYPRQRAVLVRRLGGEGYQIIDGHRRVAAARRKGFAKVYAWVVEMTEEEAYLELAASNTQAELSPLSTGGTS